MVEFRSERSKGPAVMFETSSRPLRRSSFRENAKHVCVNLESLVGVNRGHLDAKVGMLEHEQTVLDYLMLHGARPNCEAVFRKRGLQAATFGHCPMTFVLVRDRNKLDFSAAPRWISRLPS